MRWPVLTNVDVEGAYCGDREPKQDDDSSENENEVHNRENAELNRPLRLAICAPSQARSDAEVERGVNLELAF